MAYLENGVDRGKAGKGRRKKKLWSQLILNDVEIGIA